MLLGSSSSVGGVETLAARAPGSSNVHVLIVNRQVDTSAPVGGAGLPATVQVNVANLSGVTEVSLRQLDGATSIVNGPPAIALPTGSRATVTFSGYGAALLDFVTSSPSIAAPPSLPLPPVPATGVFTDDFESGLAAWLVTGTGTAAVQQTVVHAGASALALSNASGQAVAVQKDLGRPVSSSASTFYLRPTSTTAGVIASGLDATKTKVRWALSYAYGSLRAQLLDDTGAVTDIVTDARAAPPDTWTKVELRYIGTTAGGAELLVNGVSKGSVVGNYAGPNPYQVLQLSNQTAESSAYFDDVAVQGAIFADDFESGLLAWTRTVTGTATTQTAVVHSGTAALALSNGAGQSVWLVTDLGQALTTSATSFYLRPTSGTGGYVAWGRDGSSLRQRWALHFNPISRALTYMVYDDAGVNTELTSGPDPLPLDAWTKVELRYIGTTTGGAELLINDVSKGSLAGNYASAYPYQVLQLGNETPSNTTYFDDLVVK
jgi:hypothetical protein